MLKKVVDVLEGTLDYCYGYEPSIRRCDNHEASERVRKILLEFQQGLPSSQEDIHFMQQFIRLRRVFEIGDSLQNFLEYHLIIVSDCNFSFRDTGIEYEFMQLEYGDMWKIEGSLAVERALRILGSLLDERSFTVSINYHQGMPSLMVVV